MLAAANGGVGWADRLRQTLKTGAIPASIGGVSLYPSAGLPAPLPQAAGAGDDAELAAIGFGHITAGAFRMRAIAHGAFLRAELTVQLQLPQGRRVAPIGVAGAVLRVADFHWHVAPGLTQALDIGAPPRTRPLGKMFLDRRLGRHRRCGRGRALGPVDTWAVAFSGASALRRSRRVADLWELKSARGDVLLEARTVAIILGQLAYNAANAVGLS